MSAREPIANERRNSRQAIHRRKEPHRSDPLVLTVSIDADELAALRREAERYRWLRLRAVRIQGSDNWYAGVALDLRIDTGLHHMAEQAKDVTTKKPRSSKRLQ